MRDSAVCGDGVLGSGAAVAGAGVAAGAGELFPVCGGQPFRGG